MPENELGPVFNLETSMSNLDVNDPTIKLFVDLESDVETELGKQFCSIFDKFINFKNERNF